MSTSSRGGRHAIVHITSSRIEINAWPLLVVDIDLDEMRRKPPSMTDLLTMPTESVTPEIQTALDRFMSGASRWWGTEAGPQEQP